MTTATKSLLATALAASLLTACGGADPSTEDAGESFDATDKFLTTHAAGQKALPVNTDPASQALLLRAVFASWYGLPFFVEASDGRTRIFLGHFGFRTATGRYKGTPNFKLAYADYSARGASALNNWPHDAAAPAARSARRSLPNFIDSPPTTWG